MVGGAGGAAGMEDDARAHAARVTIRSGSSFLLAMRILPQRRREAMFAIYAFCREVDDIADDEAPVESKRIRLAQWRREIERLFQDRPTMPTARALQGTIREFGLAKEDFLALVDGMEMDADGMCAPSLSDLDLYCDRVASAVGRLSVRAFGAKDSAAREVARHLGQALQRTNILRDLLEDAQRGRLYLPREWLEQHGIADRDPMAVLGHPALPAVCNQLARDARSRFSAARDALTRCAPGPMRPAVVMMHVYRRILDKLERRGWTALDRPAKVPKLTKIWIALRYGLF
jgi:presqualene diphosphate synthase